MSDLFKSAAVVEQACYELRLGDYYRGQNRALINDLFNGAPPGVPGTVNVNFLEATRQGHDARGQFLNAFSKPANYFSVTDVDAKPAHKKHQYAVTITKNISRIMKHSREYFEKVRSDFASLVLHGIGPSVWESKDDWAPDPLGIEDILVPGNTLLTLKNMPFFAVFRPYTVRQLKRLTSGPKVDPAWNLDLVNKLIEKTGETIFDYGIPNSEVLTPEKMAERYKQDGGVFSSDSVPTIDCYDFYFWNDSKKVNGWNRRIILDAYWSGGIGSVAGSTGKMAEKVVALKNIDGTRDEFLYNPGDRVYADKLDNIVCFQFADLSAVAPFKYHSVRSLGFLLYAVCHLQNRLRCKFYDSLFEHMLQYFRVRSGDEFERALKINLIDRGVIDETVEFIKAQDRWTINPNLVGMGLQDLQKLIVSSASSYRQNYDNSGDGKEKTATQVMAETQSIAQLVSAALAQAYEYKKFEYNEIARRFGNKKSMNADVRKFRLNCLKDGVPESALEPDRWNVEPERVLGAGNKMMEMAISDKLMSVRNLMDPEPQRIVLRNFVLSNSDDPSLAEQLVPENPMKVTPSVHDAQLAIGSLMAGAVMEPMAGVNHVEQIEMLLKELGMMVQRAQQTGVTPKELQGFGNVASYIGKHMQILGQDKNEKERIKKYGDALGQIGNIVKALGQQLAEKMKAQGNGQGGPDPETMAKVQSQIIVAKAKAANLRESHAARTATRDTQEQMKMQRDAEKHQQELAMKRQDHMAELGMKELEAVSNSRINQLKSLNE